jgi:hypothetical protein
MSISSVTSETSKLMGENIVYRSDIVEVSIDIYRYDTGIDRSMPSIERSISVCSVSQWL